MPFFLQKKICICCHLGTITCVSLLLVQHRSASVLYVCAFVHGCAFLFAPLFVVFICIYSLVFLSYWCHIKCDCLCVCAHDCAFLVAQLFILFLMDAFASFSLLLVSHPRAIVCVCLYVCALLCPSFCKKNIYLMSFGCIRLCFSSPCATSQCACLCVCVRIAAPSFFFYFQNH